jgi:hypothetical protein
MASEGDIQTMANQLATLHVETLSAMQTVGSAIQGVEAKLRNMNQEDEDHGASGPTKKKGMEFMSKCPKFERGKDRWIDFSTRFQMYRDMSDVSDDQAKIALWNAIVGRSSRLVIASMDPRQGTWSTMNFEQYLTSMGAKFIPASESQQMKSEYMSRIQGKDEDIQNYINEKYELFKLAYPGAQDMSDFYTDCNKGVLNRNVRTHLFHFEPRSVEEYGAKAVNIVQVERKLIEIGDSESNLEGLTPVTRTPMAGAYRKVEAMEVDHLYKRRQTEDAVEECDEEEDSEECECFALYEQGFRGPCYYCRRRGHMLRNCPRKSAGLPRVQNANQPPSRGGQSWSPRQRGAMVGSRGKPSGFRGQLNQGVKRPRVNNIEEGDTPEEELKAAEEYEAEDAEEISFLGEPTL